MQVSSMTYSCEFLQMFVVSSRRLPSIPQARREGKEDDILLSGHWDRFDSRIGPELQNV